MGRWAVRLIFGTLSAGPAGPINSAPLRQMRMLAVPCALAAGHAVYWPCWQRRVHLMLAMLEMRYIRLMLAALYALDARDAPSS